MARQAESMRPVGKGAAAEAAGAASGYLADNGARSQRMAALQRAADGAPVQRTLLYKGNLITSRRDLMTIAGFDAFRNSKDKRKGEKLEDKLKCFELTDDAEAELQEVKEKVTREKSEEELRNERGQQKSTEIKLPFRVKDYPRDSTLYAPIDHAIIVINDGRYQFVGTSGLIGCVEVMIECHTEKDKGYLVAHVNSDIASDEKEIRRQLELMLGALGDELNEKLDWSDFSEGSETRKLTLVRGAEDGEQELLVNMRNLLAESGAHMLLVNSTSASMHITATGASYLNNDRGLQGTPELDYRNEKGYPFK